VPNGLFGVITAKYSSVIEEVQRVVHVVFCFISQFNLEETKPVSIPISLWAGDIPV